MNRHPASRVAVVGASLSGLVWAGLLAQAGHRVSLIEEETEVLWALCAGRLFADEPGLWSLLTEGRRRGYLRLAGHWNDLAEAEVVLFAAEPAVGDGGADAGSFDALVAAMAVAAAPGALIVAMNGLPEGGIERMAWILDAARPDGSLGLALGPEPLSRRRAIAEAMGLKRILTGCDRLETAERLRRFFAPLGRPVLVTSAASAERIVDASTAFGRVEEAYWGEIAQLSRVASEVPASWALAI